MIVGGNVRSQLRGNVPGALGETGHDGLSANFISGIFYSQTAGVQTIYASAQTMFAWSSSAKWTRNSSGVLVQTAANEPAYEWSLGGAALGVLIEAEAATNRNVRSGDLSNASWVKTGGTVALTGGAGPDGNTMSVFTEDTATSLHRVRTAGWTGTGAVDYCPSIWLRAGTRQYVSFGILSTGTIAFWATVDTTNWTISQQTTATAGATANANSAALEDWGGGLYRLSLSGQVAVGATFYTVVCSSNSATPATLGVSFTGTSSTIVAYGCQSELGLRATSYIPTTSALVTRNADVVTWTLGTEWNAAAATVLAKFIPRKTIAQLTIASGIVTSIDDGTDVDAAWMYQTGTQGTLAVRDSANNQTTADGVTPTIGTLQRMAHTFVSGRMNLADNGTLAAENTSNGMPTVTTLRLGVRTGGTEPHCYHLQNLDMYPVEYSRANLAALTT